MHAVDQELSALHVLPRLCIPPLVARLHAPPDDARAPPRHLCAALCMVALTASRAHPTAPEIVSSLAFLATQLDARAVGCTRLLTLCSVALALAAAASRPLLQLWLGSRAYNANFYYAATTTLTSAQLMLAYDVAATVVFADAVDGDAAATVQQVWRGRGAQAQRRRK